jgi:hypothetical protein
MTTARQKESDPMPVACRDDARGEDARPIRRDVVRIPTRRTGSLERQYRHAGVVVV